MNREEVRYHVSDRIGEITLSRYLRRNALNEFMLTRLVQRLDDAVRDTSIGAIILTGDVVFSAGADIKELSQAPDGYHDGIGQSFIDAANAIRTHPTPVIAAVEGYALGGALMLALSCDLMVLGEGAQIGLSEIDVGLVGGIAVLRELVGRSFASRMVLLGERIRATEAMRAGLATVITADGEAIDAARTLAGRVCTHDRTAISVAKTLLRKDGTSRQIMIEERDANTRLIESNSRTRNALAHFAGGNTAESDHESGRCDGG